GTRARANHGELTKSPTYAERRPAIAAAAVKKTPKSSSPIRGSGLVARTASRPTTTASATHSTSGIVQRQLAAVVPLRRQRAPPACPAPRSLPASNRIVNASARLLARLGRVPSPGRDPAAPRPAAA